MNNAWKCLPVREFVDRCNWENIALETSSESLVRLQKSLSNWQCLTSRDFFQLNNWSGQVVFGDGLGQSGWKQKVFDLTLKTEGFWDCFNWLGEKETLAPAKVEQLIEHTEHAIAEVKDFTLNDLSQLF